MVPFHLLIIKQILAVQVDDRLSYRHHRLALTSPCCEITYRVCLGLFKQPNDGGNAKTTPLTVISSVTEADWLGLGGWGVLCVPLLT
jgi:hypothetical protein